MHKICRLKEEGGLDIRRLNDVAKAFSYKLWWKFREGNSLWAEFMKAKYCKMSHPMTIGRPANSSKCWLRMTKIKYEAEPHIVWLVGNGRLDIQKDKWLTIDVPVAPSISFVQELFDPTGYPNDELIIDLLGQNVHEEIRKRYIHLNATPDRPIWILSSDGKFNFKSAWDQIREKYACPFLFKCMWSRWLPQKISVFLWKCMHNIVPSDVAVMKKGIILASKCCCCKGSPGIESTTHLLLVSETAKEVWTFFGSHMQQRTNFITLPHILTFWWKQIRGHTL